MSEKCPKCGAETYKTCRVTCETLIICPVCRHCEQICNVRAQVADRTRERDAAVVKTNTLLAAIAAHRREIWGEGPEQTVGHDADVALYRVAEAAKSQPITGEGAEEPPEEKIFHLEAALADHERMLDEAEADRDAILARAAKAEAELRSRPKLDRLMLVATQEARHALVMYRTHHARGRDDEGLSLCDVFTPAKDDDIAAGKDELHLLIDDVCAAILDGMRSEATEAANRQATMTDADRQAASAAKEKP